MSHTVMAGRPADLEKGEAAPTEASHSPALTFSNDDTRPPSPCSPLSDSSDPETLFEFAGAAERTDKEKGDTGKEAEEKEAEEKEAEEKEADLPGEKNEAAPDGGLLAWSQVLAGFLLNAIAWGTPSMFGVYQLYYTSSLGLAATDVSWLGSIQTFLAYLLSTVSGRLADAGYGRPTTVTGTVLVVVGGLWTAQIPLNHGPAVPASLFLAQGLFTGVGLGLLTAASLPAIQARFSPRRQSLALALSSTGVSAGGALLPLVVQNLLPVVGFAWAVRCTALVALVAGGVAVLLLREPPASSSSSSTTTSSFSLRSLFTGLVDVSAFREVPFMLFCVASFLLYWSFYFGFDYMNVYAQSISGYSTQQATTMLIVATAVGIPARVAVGLAAHAGFGVLDTMVVSCFLAAGTLLGWLAVGRSHAGIYVFAVLFGLSNGAVQGLWTASVAVLAGRPPKRGDDSDSADSDSDDAKTKSAPLGVRFGMAGIVAAVATLAGPPTAASLIRKTGGDMAVLSSYRGAQLWAGLATLMCAVVMGAARVSFLGWRLREGRRRTERFE